MLFWWNQVRTLFTVHIFFDVNEHQRFRGFDFDGVCCGFNSVGAEALELLEAGHRFGLIVLDLLMDGVRIIYFDSDSGYVSSVGLLLLYVNF